MSKNKKKLVMSIVTMLIILVGGDIVLAYLTYVIAHYAITEASSNGEYIVCVLSLCLPMFAIYLNLLLFQEVQNDIYRARWMR